jgi:hypothetical protein
MSGVKTSLVHDGALRTIDQVCGHWPGSGPKIGATTSLLLQIKQTLWHLH